MSSRRQHSDKHAIPDNAEFIQIPNSDGDQRTWPTNTTRIVDSEGHVNFMQPCDPNHSIHKKWRVDVGRAIALKLEYPEGKSYVLDRFPDGYAMFDHHKGKADAPRHDIYLFGAPGRRFRSVPEFIPHAIWLVEGRRGNCSCKYCSKRAQKDITYQMADVMPMRKTPTQSPGPSRRPMHDPKPKKPSHLRTPYAAVQRAPVPAKVTKIPCLADRNADLRAVHCKTSMRMKRWFRPGELLWCALDPPIEGPNGAVDGIKFWPGLVEDTKLQNNVQPRPPTNKEGRLSQNNQNGESLQDDDDDDAPPWTIQQSTVYKVRLLAVNYEFSVHDEQVLPYQAYVVPTPTLDALQNAWRLLDFDEEKLWQFNPRPPPGDVAAFDQAISPYAVALQIASRLSHYWCLTDEWEHKLTIPTRQLGSSLTDAITQAQTSATPLSQAYPNTSSADPSMSQAELNATSMQMLGPPPNTQISTQIRYQGLWWGAEHIWVDDFVRLKVARRCLAPNGAQNIYPPAGPGKSLLKTWDSSSSRNLADVGASSRGVFMRLDGLILVNTEQNGVPKRECRACGMLYELADHDFEEPSHSPANGHTPSTSTLSPKPNANQGSSSEGPSTPKSQQYAHPTTSRSYPLPAAPTGFKFRQILPDGHEAVVSLTLISGRYYPSILQHPLLHDVLRSALERPEAEMLEGYSYLWAIEGLTPGYYNSVDPASPKKSREWMLKDADKEARKELIKLVEERERELAMEVEDDGSVKQELEPISPSHNDEPISSISSADPTSNTQMDVGM